jgi:hypothetical protein
MIGTPMSKQTQLHGPWLQVARIGWVILVTFALTLFCYALLLRYEYLVYGTTPTDQQLYPLPSNALELMTDLGFSRTRLAVFDLFFEIVPTILFVAIAALIFWRKSNDWMALLVSATLVLMWMMGPPTLTTLGLLQPVWQVVIIILNVLGLGSLLTLFYLFPDGRFVPGFTRWLVIIWWLSLLLALTDPATFLPTPLAAVETFPQVLLLIYYLAWFITGVIAQLYRYRVVANQTQRQQTKWVVASFVITFTILTIIGAPVLFFPILRQPGMTKLLYDLYITIPASALALLAIPTSFAVAVLRYRLFEIDLIINRALVYGALSITLVIVYGTTILITQALFQTVAGQRSQFPVIVSTLVIAALFAPLRQQIQQVIDRRFYRHKYDTKQTLNNFANLTRDEVDLEILVGELLSVVQHTIQPQQISLWLKPVVDESDSTSIEANEGDRDH